MTREELIKQIRTKQSFLCVGLDTDIKKIPQHLLQADDPIFEFNKAIIDATAPYSVAYLNENYPEQFIIADAKRGDIGNTSQMYARTFFETYNLDALTVAPYMGEDSVTPFLAYEGKWVILLALTSNKGSHDFQLMEDAQGIRLFEHVLTKSQAWGNADNMMYVVGATQGEAFKDIRRHAPNHFLLVPGIGAQGGSLHDVCQYGMNKDCGLLANSSRGIIYASNGVDFAQVAAEKAREIQEEMARELKAILPAF